MGHEEFMDIAVAEAKKGVLQGDGGPFGAVVVKEGKVIAKAHNCVVKKSDPTAHAEVRAIRKAAKKLRSFDLSGAVLYTTCMPCPMCLGAIMWANITEVYYGASSEDADAIGFRDKRFYEKEELSLRQIAHEKSLEPFVLWSEKSDKILY